MWQRGSARRRTAELEARLAEARALAAHWEREAVLRGSSIASRLGAQIMAARRLAAAAEDFLAAGPEDAREARDELRRATRHFRRESCLDDAA
jgi:hypothetical protein